MTLHRPVASILAVLVSASLSIAATDVSGIIPKSTTWTASASPFRLTGDLQIAYRATLKIEPGVQIEGNGKALTVFGKLTAIGSQSSPIPFVNIKLSFGNNKSDQPASIDIRYANMQGGLFLSGSSGYGSFTLRDSILSDLSDYMYVWYPTDDCYIERNQFIRTFGISIGHSGPSVYVRNNLFYQTTPTSSGYPAIQNWAAYKGETIVKYNTFQDLKCTAVALKPGYNNAAMAARDNYWGTTDEAAIAAMIWDRNDDASASGKISFKPFLSAPHAQTPKPIK